MRRTLTSRHSGQSLLTVAVFLGLIFITIGLAIDGGMIYVQRRLMQNTADAACLAAANQISLGKEDSEAQAAAAQVVVNNLGVNAPGTLSYSTPEELYNNGANVGSGGDLVHGIEITNADVRVALQSPATTFFMRIAGVTDYTVAARARCNAAAAGGGVPFAVARWRGYDTSGDLATDGLTTDQPLPQTYRRGRHLRNMIVRDILEGTSADTGRISQWPGWGTADYPGDPEAGTGLYSQASPAASESDQGYEVVIAGSGASPNVGDTSFSGPIVLDYRQTTYPQPLFYNGLTPDTSLNVYKDFATRYILGTYPGPNVIPGQQIAYYNGISAGLIEKPFDLRYNVGDTVTVLIYNGTIYDSPSFVTTYPSASDSAQSRPGVSYSGDYDAQCVIEPSAYIFDGSVAYPSGSVSLSPASYQLRIEPEVFSRYKLRAFLSTDPANWGAVEGRWNGGSWQPLDINGSAPVESVSTGGETFTFELQQSETIECEYTETTIDPLTGTATTITNTVVLPKRYEGTQTIYLEAQDTNTSKRRARYAFIDMNANNNDFYVYFPGEIAYQPFEPGRPPVSAEFNIETKGGTSLYLDNPDVDASLQWFSADLSPIGAPADITASVARQGSKNELTIDVGANAQTGKEYYLRIGIEYTQSGETYTHWAWYYVQVRAPLNNSSSISQFVYALGYATFEITEINSNSIKGRAISGLLRPEEITAGLQPRLVPWE